MNLKNIFLLLFIAMAPMLASAQKYLSKEAPEVTIERKGLLFSSNKTLVENISEAPDFTIITKVLMDKSLQENLDKPEMITMFVVSDNAFSNLDKKQKDSIIGNKKLMNSMVKFLSIPGRIDNHGLQRAVEKHDGTAYLTTLNGENLGITNKNGKLFLIDSQGRMSEIIESDFYHKKGIFHIVDGLVFPSSNE